MAPQNKNHRRKEQVADELRETNEKLIKRLAGHRLTQDVLRKDAQTFRAIADTLPVGVSLAEDRKLTWANPAFMKIHGFESANDYFGKSTEILFASHDEFDRVGRIAYSDLQVGNIAELSAKQKRKDGSVFDARLRLALFSASDPAKKIVICCTTDISEKVEAEERLRKSDERYRTSLEESFDGALIVKGSQILLANSRLGEMLGYSKEELEGMEYFTFLHPDYRELVTRRAAARIRGESVPRYYEVKLLRKDGASFDVELNARVIEIEGEACIQVWIRDVSERKKAEEATRQSEERYRTLVEESFDGVLIHDGNKVLFANSRFCEMLGYHKDELEGMDLGPTLHPDHRELLSDRQATWMRGENVPGPYEINLLRKDGSSLETEANSRAIVEQGELRVQVWIREVSERRRAETALRKSEERYRTLVEESFDGIMIHDGTKIVFANSRLREMLGYQEEELEGMDHLLTVHPDYRELVAQRVAARQRGETVPSFYGVRLQRKDGSNFDAEISGRPIDVGGQIGAQVWIKDISERKRAEDAIQQSEERYRTLVEQSFDGILIHDATKIVFVNSRLCKMLDYQKEELEGMDYRLTVHPDYQDIVAHRAAARMRGEDVPSHYEIKHQRKDGSSFDSEVNARPIQVQGAPGVQVWIKDISEQKKAKEEARRSEERYRTLVEDSFDGIMIHDGKKVVFANSRHCEMLGYRKEEIEGMDWRLSVHPDCLEMVKARAAARIRGQNVLDHYEIKLKRKDGSYFDAEINARPIEAQGLPLVQVWTKDISERKRAEEALRESEKKYRAVFDNAAAGINLNRHGRILEANAAFANMLGYSQDEIAQLAFHEVTHPDDLEITAQCHEELVSGERDSCRFQKRYIRKDGRILWADVWAAAIRNETGEYQAGISAAIDITDRKRAEEDLRRSEANYRAIFDSMNDAIFVHDIETGAIIDVNQKMCEMYGYTREEASRLTAGQMGSTEGQPAQAMALRRIGLAARDEPQLLEWQAKTKDGRLFWVEVNLRKAVLDEKPYVLAVVRDITDRKRAEQERENERQKFRTLVDGAPFGIVMVKKDNTYEYVNPKFTEIFGYYLNDIPDGNHWSEKSWPDPEHRREVIAAWHADLAELRDGAMKARTFKVTCADGTQKTITLRTAQLHTGEFIITCEDITEQVRGEQERENLRHQLLHAQKMEALGTLVGGIAHDFNNLLTIILGYSELLLVEKTEDDPEAADLKKVVEAASSGAALVQRMLTFSEQTDTQLGKLGPLNLNSEIENMKELLSRTIPKMISFDLRLSEDLALIEGDTGQIQQVIMNLALNAVDAMPDGGKLTIETKNAIPDEAYSKNHSGTKPGNYVLLTVSDTGHGMSTQTMQRMYDPFFTTKNRDFNKGTGLGLAIVHSIVQGHGGRIICDSEPGKRTTFQLYFPAISHQELTSEEGAEDSICSTPLARGAETILLVDDEEMVRDLGARILKKAGYKVVTAGNGKEGLAVYQTRMEKIALVILDLIMPEMGGEQCLEEILKINPKAKILISTGYSSGDETTRMRIEALASGYVAKPFTLSDMLKMVREILDRD